MAEKKILVEKKIKTETTESGFHFTRDNYLWMIIGLVIIAIGMFLMAGGKSTDPTVFDPNEVYSPRRITIAPFLIVVGLGVEVYAIFKNPKHQK